MVTRASETVAISTDLKARALPAVDAWIDARKQGVDASASLTVILRT